MASNDIISGYVQLPLEVTADRLPKTSNLSDSIKTNYPTPKINSGTNNNNSNDSSLADDIVLSGRGFYYDQQLKNRNISVTLHPNTVTEDGGISWLPARNKNEVDSDGYMIEPLCSSILEEDYQVAVSNTWSEFGDDAIGRFFNSFKPYAPYAEHFVKMLKEANRKEDAMKESNNVEDRNAINSSIGKILDGFTDKLFDIMEDTPSILNRTLVAQGARFSYYSGTGIGFGNLVMKFTLFPDWKKDKSGEILTIDEQLSKLYPYCFGKYVKALDENGNVTGTNINFEEFVTSHKDDVNRYFGWQLPPGGYISNTKDIDEIQFGTLKLKLGSYYSLDNLVCGDIQLQFSKQMAKFWNSTSKSTIINPLYCNVSLTLKPAVKFTDEKLKKLMNGESMLEDRSKLEDLMYNKLLNEYNNNESLLGR